MKHTLRIPALISIATLACVAFACGGGGGDDSSGAGGDSASVGTGVLKCGIIENGEVTTSPDTGSAQAAALVSVVDSNLVDISVGGENVRVRLLGLSGTADFDNTAATKIITSAAAGGMLYYPVSDCTKDGGQVGQLLTSDGKSLAETLISREVAGRIETTGSCGEEKIGACYAALATGVPTTDMPARQASDFLWKPDSESGYNPGGVSILLNPCDAKVLVNGEEQVDYPSGNGRCVTVRNGRPGCDFGTNIRVELIDRDSGEPIYFGNESNIIIPNGCERFEYEGFDTGEETPTVSCSAPVADFRYSPSYEECGGNAAVILSGELQGAFSVQLRLPDGGDRLDEDCALARCSPYKVQRYIDGTGVKIACFGAPGDAVLMNDVVHSSIKMAGDDSTPHRFCISDPAVAVN